MIKNFMVYGLLSILLLYGISSYESIFGESNNTEYQFLNKFGSKGKQDGQFNRPEDLAIDPDGKVFVADTGNSRIQVFGTKSLSQK